MKSSILKLIMVLGLISGPAFGDHRRGNCDIGRLATLSSRLNEMVEYSNLRYEVKMSVANFNSAIVELSYCSPGSNWLIDKNHDPDYGSGSGYGRGCENQEYRAKSLFRNVQNYLNDASEYRRIFQTYKMIEETMYNL